MTIMDKATHTPNRTNMRKFSDLKKIVKNAIKKVKKKSYFNIMKYAYGTQEIRHSVITPLNI